MHRLNMLLKCLALWRWSVAAPMLSLAERLGVNSEARLLIVHADDIGVTHSVNAACFQAMAMGVINSASVMVPCPAFPEAAAFARAHPEFDFGIHLTLTSERPSYRWGPTAPHDKVASLVDRDGYFHRTWTAETPINPLEVEIELRAQIETALTAGLLPTHLDSHQMRLQMSGRDLLEVYVRLGHEYGLPVLITRDWLAVSASYRSLLGADDVVIDRVVTISPQVEAGQWPEFYRHAIETLAPGVTEFLIHPGLDDAELRAFSANSPDWGAAWRQRDFDFFTSSEVRTLLARHEIRLITWREIKQRLLAPGLLAQRLALR
jgi:chitin disaccharide deacetylase